METRWPSVSPDRVGIERVSSVRTLEIPEVVDPTGLKRAGAPPDQILPDFLHPPTMMDRFVMALQSGAMGEELFAPSEYLESLGALRARLAGRLRTVAPTGLDSEIIQRAIGVLD